MRKGVGVHRRLADERAQQIERRDEADERAVAVDDGRVMEAAGSERHRRVLDAIVRMHDLHRTRHARSDGGATARLQQIAPRHDADGPPRLVDITSS
jgi:hypothetical protein